MWRYGYGTPPNYDDNQLFCGGFPRQVRNGYKCGICGDPFDGPRPHEAGGKYATGIIVDEYPVGSVMPVQVQLTAHHKGYFEFKICPNNDVKTAATQECLDRYPLTIAGESGTKYQLPNEGSKTYTVRLQLPEGLSCSQCVLQWRYHTGNSWGVDKGSKRGCVGCGYQEEFYGCADIAIRDFGTQESTTKRSPSGTTSPTTSGSAAPGAEDENEGWITEKPTTTTRLPPAQTATTQASSVPTTQASSVPTTQASSAPTTQASKTTTQPPTQPPGGIVCRGVPPYDRVPGMRGWCNRNCPGNCPTTHCECKAAGSKWSEVEKKTCRPVGAFVGVPGAGAWCVANCNHTPPHCPASYCRCS